MINKLALLSIFFFLNTAQASHEPENTKSDTSIDTTARLFYRPGEKWVTKLQFTQLDEKDTRKLKKIELGVRYRIHDNLKLGLVVGQESGRRYGEDWVLENSAWFWKDKNSFDENYVGVEIYPRFILMEDLLFDFKASLLQVDYRDHRTVKLRPGLSYFIFKNGKLLSRLFFHLEYYYPLNYGGSTVFEKWIYLGAMFPVSKKLDLGLYYAKKEEFWGSTPDFSALENGDTWLVSDKTNVIGLFLNYNL